MNGRFVGVMAFYGLLTGYVGPMLFGKPQGYIAGAAGSYILYQSYGRDFVGY